jgi:hypothetical protein
MQIEDGDANRSLASYPRVSMELAGRLRDLLGVETAVKKTKDELDGVEAVNRPSLRPKTGESGTPSLLYPKFSGTRLVSECGN